MEPNYFAIVIAVFLGMALYDAIRVGIARLFGGNQQVQNIYINMPENVTLEELPADEV